MHHHANEGNIDAGKNDHHCYTGYHIDANKGHNKYHSYNQKGEKNKRRITSAKSLDLPLA